MRRVTAVALAGLLAIGGYGTADVLDLAPGILTLAPEVAAYPTSPSPTSSPGATAALIPATLGSGAAVSTGATGIPDGAAEGSGR